MAAMIAIALLLGWNIGAAAASDCPAPVKLRDTPGTIQEIALSPQQAHCLPQQVVQCSEGSYWERRVDQIRSDNSKIIKGYCRPKPYTPSVPLKPPQETLHTGTTEFSKELRQEKPLTTDYAQNGSAQGALVLPAEVRTKAKEMGIPDVVLERGFNNYVKLLSQGKTTRGCFMAGDLTTPERATMYMVCMKPKVRIVKTESFYGSGQGSGCYSTVYKNDKGCAQYFGDRMHYCLPAGGNFVTGKSTLASGSKRDFLELIGLDDGENSNTRSRRTGFHYAVTGAGKPYDNLNFPEASQGCYTLPSTLKEFAVGDLSSSNPGLGLAVYIYPSRQDVSDAVQGKPTYWNQTCKDKIKKPGWIGSKDLVVDYDTSKTQELEYIGNYTDDEPTADAQTEELPPDLAVPGVFN